MEGLLVAVAAGSALAGLVLAGLGARKVRAARQLFGAERFGWGPFWTYGAVCAGAGAVVLGATWAAGSVLGVLAVVALGPAGVGVGMWLVGFRTQEASKELDYDAIRDDPGPGGP